MIIDLILDRKDGQQYDAKDFYNNILQYEKTFHFRPDISRALDGGTNEDVQRALCAYIDENGWNPAIKDYINSVDWLKSKPTKKYCVRLYLHTFADIEVEAENEDEAIELAENINDIDQLLDNLIQDNESDVTEIN